MTNIDSDDSKEWASQAYALLKKKARRKKARITEARRKKARITEAGRKKARITEAGRKTTSFDR